ASHSHSAVERIVSRLSCEQFDKSVPCWGSWQWPTEGKWKLSPNSRNMPVNVGDNSFELRLLVPHLRAAVLPGQILFKLGGEAEKGGLVGVTAREHPADG